MKPDWDKLMKEFQDSPTILIGDVDCTAKGKAKCEEVGVRGYPTIKYGDPNDLQDYKGGRSFADLKKFADNLRPACSPANMEHCDEQGKKLIEQLKALSKAERDAKIKEKDDKIAQLEADFKVYVEKLNAEHQEETEKKEKSINEIKRSGLSLLKSVHAFEKKNKGSEL